MSENEYQLERASDDEILAGIARRMARIEVEIPQPPALDWHSGRVAPSRLSGRLHFRPALGLGGMAVAAVLVVSLAVSAGPLANHGMPGGTPQASLAPNTMEVIYKASQADGSAPSAAQLESVAAVVRARADRYSNGTPATVTVSAPGEITAIASSIGLISLSPSTRLESYYSPAVLQRLIADQGHVEFVPLPPDRFGTGGAAGPEAEPAFGARIDASLSAEMDNSQLAGGTATLVMDQQPDSALSTYDFVLSDSIGGRWQAWAAAHSGERVAVVLDGRVMTVFTTPGQGNGKSISIGGLRIEDAQRIDSAVHTARLPLALVMMSVRVSQELPYMGLTPTQGITAPPAPTIPPIVSPAAPLPTDIQATGLTVGNPNAPNTIDIWIDYQCALCRAAHDEVLPRLITDYVQTGKAKLVYHDFLVLDMYTGNSQSLDAANAARCAADQGKLVTYQDWLFENQGSEQSSAFDIDRLLQMGRLAGLDMSTFQPCVQNGAHNAEVQAESAAAESRGITGAPAYFVNGRQVASGDPADVLARIGAEMSAGSSAP